jgi:hypothetical protein
MKYLCQNLYSNKIDIFCLPETGLDWKQPYYPGNQFREIIDNFWGRSRLITSTSNTPLLHTIRWHVHTHNRKMVGPNLETRHDPHVLGRWSYITITGKNGRDILLVTTYQACKQSINSAGAKSAYAQQWHSYDRPEIQILIQEKAPSTSWTHF